VVGKEGEMEGDSEESGIQLIGEGFGESTGRLLDSVVLDFSGHGVGLDVEGTVCGVELFVNPYLISRLTAKHVSSRQVLSLIYGPYDIHIHVVRELEAWYRLPNQVSRMLIGPASSRSSLESEARDHTNVYPRVRTWSFMGDSDLGYSKDLVDGNQQ
jgi:hypothetical protein